MYRVARYAHCFIRYRQRYKHQGKIEMKNKFRGILCFGAAALLCGCAAKDVQPDITVVDVGDYSISDSAPESESGSAFSHAPESSDNSEITSPEDIIIDNDTPVSADNPADLPSQPAGESASESVASSVDKALLPQETPSEPPESSAPDTVSSEQTRPTNTSETSSAKSSTQDKPAEIPVYEFTERNYKALNYSEVRGVWISYIELSEMLTGKSESGFRAAIGAAYDNCKALGLNTVYVHVRSHGDAYYPSKLFMWSKYVTGTAGQAPSFDPLQVMIEEAHSREISFQAWINPLRACTSAELSAQSGYAIGDWAGGSKSGKNIVAVNGTYYLNPAYDEVIKLIADGASEIVSNYDVDGLHIDDYFYPTTDASFDSSAYSGSGYASLSAFRFNNCDRLVKSLYTAVKRSNSTALFGVSCQGSMENNYNQMYADVKKWCTESGYTDYIMPQIYYGFDNSTQPYETCTSEWAALAQKGKIPLITGLSVSKIGLEDKWAGAGKNEWINSENILSRQFLYAAEQPSYGGICLYSYRSIFAADSAVSSQVNKEIEALKKALTD